jgi:uncharacterized phage protein (TIGR01671 family)
MHYTHRLEVYKNVVCADFEFKAPFYQNEDGNIIMQYTGFKDKNGNEIYEGDLLQDNRRQLWVVSFGENSIDNSLASFTIRVVGKKSVYPLDASVFNQIVVGNIYNNPELLNK